MSEIERRVAALEEAVGSLTAGRPTGPLSRLDGELEILEQLQQRFPDGAVSFAGHAQVADGPVAWQWGRLSTELLEQSWDASSGPLAALGHPVRLRLLQLVLTGTRTTAELGKDPDLGTTGQLHHHLRTLLSAGWLQSAGRGRYSVPVQRIIPLLIIVSATEA